MRKSPWKLVAVTVVLALGAMAMSALAGEAAQKSAPCRMSAKMAKPGCAMQARAVETRRMTRGQDARGCDCGMLCGKPDCPVHGQGAGTCM